MGYWKEVMRELFFLYAVVMQFCPAPIYDFIVRSTHKFMRTISPYMSLKFPEYTSSSNYYYGKSEVYMAIQTYLTENASKQAVKLRCEKSRRSSTMMIAVDDNEEINEEFQGAKLWWSFYKNENSERPFNLHGRMMENRCYTLSFHNRHRELIIDTYLAHVMEEAKEIEMRNRELRLYTNKENEWYSAAILKHPGSFETLALKPEMKEAILNDLVKFKNGKEFYAKVGKPWKRGYLLYGPPGTGKSTMIAAMAKFLNYDVYDLELTAVKDNSELRELLMDTESKSIVVIEDIDCSIDLTGQREKSENKKQKQKQKQNSNNITDEAEEDNSSKVTLSGLLNVIDGIWSSCVGERVIVFTTNFVEKLDPALIRRGRMDMHIELSYCCFQVFKVLAKNYLDVDSHPLFPKIEKLLEEKAMTPSDVVENLMSKAADQEVDTCFLNLIEALELAKSKEEEEEHKTQEKERNKATEEKRKKAMEKAGDRGREEAAINPPADEVTESSSVVPSEAVEKDLRT